MGYQLRLHSEIRDWLADLRDTEPELARLVGEAVLALIDAGETLGPPLVGLAGIRAPAAGRSQGQSSTTPTSASSKC